jgi:zinc transporter 2
VVCAAALIYCLHERWPDGNGLSYWYRVDPICTLGAAVLVLMSTMTTVRGRGGLLSVSVSVPVCLCVCARVRACVRACA